MITDDRDADGVRDFCKRHGFSPGLLYSQWRQGGGPRFMRIGGRRFITREAGADWRRELEAATQAARLVTQRSQSAAA